MCSLLDVTGLGHTGSFIK